MPNKKSDILFHTPSASAQKLLYYPIAAGNYKRTHGYRIDRQRFDSFLAIYILEGDLSLTQNKTTVTARPGKILLIDCYQPHVYFTETEVKMLWIHYDGSESRKWYEQITSAKGQLFSANLTAVEKLGEIMEQVRTNKNEYIISETIYTFLCELMRPDGISNSDTEIRTAIKTAETYIREHFAEPLTVADIAEQTHFSPSYLNTFFRKATGFSIYEFLLKTRLDAAKSLLTQTSLSVAHVAYYTGFNNVSNFMFFFKKQTGFSALKFRKQLF